ncbi:MAG: hypothetical protein J3Q66DRAFT_412071 [Benniella sp.]|nr:MAG: hypothetical protein J3Q66DRAFT_412071 [Benniella sp.]
MADGDNGQQQQPVQVLRHDNQLSGQCADDDSEEDDGLCHDEEDHEHAAQVLDEQFKEEPQPDQDGDADADDPVDQQAVESNGSQIKRLFTVVNTLRRLSPQVSVGSTSALQLSSNALYEILGSSSEKQFDITGPSGQVIRGAPDAAMPANKEAVMASFFDLNRMQSICFDHNLVFANRMTCTDRNRIRLEGKLMPESHLRGGIPLESASRRNRSSGTSYVWAQERITGKDAKKSETDHQNIEQELFALKRQAYYWSKAEKAVKSKADGKADSQQPTPVKVGWHAHQVEEEPARIDLRDVITEARHDPFKMVAGGGDPGFRVMLEGQSLTLNELSCHIDRYEALTTSNRFQVLTGKSYRHGSHGGYARAVHQQGHFANSEQHSTTQTQPGLKQDNEHGIFHKETSEFQTEETRTEQDEDSNDDFVEEQSMDDELSMDSVQRIDEQSVDDESADDTIPGNHMEKLERDAEKARAHM